MWLGSWLLMQFIYLYVGAENADLIVQLPFGTISAKFTETDATYNKIGKQTDTHFQDSVIL